MLLAGDWGGAVWFVGVMISRPTSIGVRDATAVTQGTEWPEQGTVVEDAAAAAVAWPGGELLRPRLGVVRASSRRAVHSRVPGQRFPRASRVLLP